MAFYITVLVSFKKITKNVALNATVSKIRYRYFKRYKNRNVKDHIRDRYIQNIQPILMENNDDGIYLVEILFTKFKN